ncbi:MAG TPA: hypothetical protein VMV07_09000 [Streptosporangiaceae bacterium]|nr:hypothetical protein [Streptosporangiaceae bacterium]
MSGRRIDVTATQAVASMLATLTGAIAASSLGIAGTIIGAAFMSLASTVGAAVYKHYIARSNERLRAAAVAAAVVRRHRARDPAAPDATETEIMPAFAGRFRGWPDHDRPRGAEPTRDLGSPAGTTGTRTPDAHAPDAHAPDAHAPATQKPDAQKPGIQHGTRRKWLMAAAATLGVFVIAMGAITAFEAIAGKPLETVIWHRQASGTTLGGLAHNSPASPRPSSHLSHPSTGRTPTGSARPTVTPSNSVSPTPAPSPSASPSSSASPTSSASPSSSASPGSSPPASPGTGASSGPATSRTPAVAARPAP